MRTSHVRILLHNKLILFWGQSADEILRLKLERAVYSFVCIFWLPSKNFLPPLILLLIVVFISAEATFPIKIKTFPLVTKGWWWWRRSSKKENFSILLHISCESKSISLIKSVGRLNRWESERKEGIEKVFFFGTEKEMGSH